MNYLGLLAGDVAGTIGTKIAQELIQAVTPAIKSGGKEFFDIFQKNIDTEKLNLQDLNLDQEEKSSIMELRNLAIENGLSKFEIEINGNKYQMHTKDLSLTPVV